MLPTSPFYLRSETRFRSPQQGPLSNFGRNVRGRTGLTSEMLRVDFVTLFPEAILPLLHHSILGRAQDRGITSYRTINPRDYCYDRHLKVDDVPYGGEPGMLIRAEPVALAVQALTLQPGTAIVLTDPAAPLFNQKDAYRLAQMPGVVFLCGHYEGIDHRIRTQVATDSFSIGDYILTNGEMPALVMADAVVRLLPGVLGNAGSLAADSFSNGLLSAPNFTRPASWRGEEVPPVLLSGDHRAISKWRRQQALLATKLYRPDLLASAPLEKGDLDLLSS